MGRWPTRVSLVPWWLPDTDLAEAVAGEFKRDIVRNGKPERQVALHVVGQFPSAPSLGLIAVRCSRKGGGPVVPLTLSIPDTPGFDIRTAGPRRLRYEGEDGS